MKPIVILGIFVADTAYRAERQPKMGETILGTSFVLGPGGKGSNQAVAAAMAGAETHFISRLGKDPFADMALATWAKAGVLGEVTEDTESYTGAAYIFIENATEVEFLGGVLSEALVFTGDASHLSFSRGLMVGGNDAVSFSGVASFELTRSEAQQALPGLKVSGEHLSVLPMNGAQAQTLRLELAALDIRATRKLPENIEQRVGVLITGNAQAPRVGLFADPDLPDGDKLAWLVLGRPASAAGAQAFVLQQAARRLLSSGGEPLDGALARTLGIDEIGFSGSGTSADGTTTAAALTLGKRLSNDLYLSYEQSLAGAMSTVSILYDLSRRLTLRARAGTENAIDLIFTHRYD